MTPDQEQVWAAMTAIYDGFLAGTPATEDALMHPDVTIWDSAEPTMVRGLVGLQRLRASRPAGEQGPTVVALDATDPVIDVWGDVALVRHLLRVRFADPAQPDEVIRNTSVWRRIEGRWLAVHNHEDVLTRP